MAAYYEVATTDRLAKLEPQEDLAVQSGDAFKMQCTAPAGSVVTATVKGKAVQLKQNVVAAQEGAAATFSASYTVPAVAGTVDLGNISYTLHYNGNKSTASSAGRLFAVGENETLAVQIKNVSSSVFSEATINSAILTTGKRGAVDAVTEFGGDAVSGAMYRLRMGGWIQAAAATPLTDAAQIDNTVSAVDFSKDTAGEIFILKETSPPFIRRYRAIPLCISAFSTQI